MKILTYAASLADGAPERFRCAARILLTDGTLHPVIIHAPTKTQAREHAQAWWDEQIEKQRAKQEAAARRAAAMRAARGKPQPQPEPQL